MFVPVVAVGDDDDDSDRGEEGEYIILMCSKYYFNV